MPPHLLWCVFSIEKLVPSCNCWLLSELWNAVHAHQLGCVHLVRVRLFLQGGSLLVPLHSPLPSLNPRNASALVMLSLPPTLCLHVSHFYGRPPRGNLRGLRTSLLSLASAACALAPAPPLQHLFSARMALQLLAPGFNPRPRL